ncbi:GNAT family N-acetyltransferase [Lederbergia sp. NSJ-179]|uniref:GNAT family N-acetyltransferase n=1 Tax=Lederbergia sp. NSJ-179 TaxID=2931402 RepID=UPI001FD3C089|nr:GNAT family N-acetyltransferase [Lederbergia sp. NSJ-179]MCJ7842835.1 GNAT family N-acetyltransferase [Lederbergia sp. NSJ-179]
MKIRQAKQTDAKGIAKVQVDSWKTTYKGIVPDEFLQSMTYESREEKWKEIISSQPVFIAETKDGEIVGFAGGGMERTGKYPDFEGELYAIYILEEFQRKGLGRLLVEAVVEDLKRKNISTMTVQVLAENRSRFFYESLGAKKIDTAEIEIGGKQLTEFVYGWKNINTI